VTQQLEANIESSVYAAKKRTDSNKLRPEDRAGHDWYRFVLSFPPHLVREYLGKFGLTAGNVVLDPFCGTGTTLVESKRLGIGCVGIESNPMACFASRVKLDWAVNSKGLAKDAEQIAARTMEQLNRDGIDDICDSAALHKVAHNEKLRHLDEDTLNLILTDSISSLPLHKVLVLLEMVNVFGGTRYKDHEKLALAKSIVFGASNLQFGPEVGIGKPKADAPVMRLWMDNINAMVDDIEHLRHHKTVESRVLLGDSRYLGQLLAPESVDAVITSPPYPNEKDYTRTTRLESVLLGFIKDKEGLRAIKKGLVRSNTRGVYKGDTDDALVSEHGEIQRIANAIESRRIELAKTSGFERLYARVTKLYFGGMMQHLSSLREVLRPGARLAYVVGDQASYLQVMIKTGTLLADIASSLGYEVESIDLFRTRLATATKQQLREEVVCLKWPRKRRRAKH
jgi:hypothetical protein